MLNLHGVAAHSGKEIHISFHEHSDGIIFVLNDEIVKADYRNIISTSMCTTLSNENYAKISTVEHILSACAALNISDLRIDIDGPELPILDGSAYMFYEALLPFKKPEAKKIIAPTKVIQVSDQYILTPHHETIFDVSVDLFGVQQHFVFNMDKDSYVENIAKARTFGRYEDAQRLREEGLALGSSLENTVVLKEGKVINPEGLRYPEELARHKILDIIGDLYLSGGKILGYLKAHNPNHTLNAEFLRMVMAEIKGDRMNKFE